MAKDRAAARSENPQEPLEFSRRPDEARISHFIPSVELKGSRAEKLATLDTLIRHLETLRRSLAGERVVAGVRHEGPSRFADSPDWPWIVTGIAIVAAFFVLAVLARSCAG